MNIDAIPAGRELDAMVAEKVMGWRAVGGHKGVPSDPQCTVHVEVPRYSTLISCAWEVVEKLQETSILEHLEQRDGDEGKYVVQFCAKPNEAWWHEHAYADTAPLAICRAALKACL